MKDCVAHARSEFQLAATADRYPRTSCAAIVGMKKRAARHMKREMAHRPSNIGLDNSSARTSVGGNSTARNIAAKSHATRKAPSLRIVPARLMSFLIAHVAKHHFRIFLANVDRAVRTQSRIARSLAERLSAADTNANNYAIKVNVGLACKRRRSLVGAAVRNQPLSAIKG